VSAESRARRGGTALAIVPATQMLVDVVERFLETLELVGRGRFRE
jgi:hypothetical protein